MTDDFLLVTGSVFGPHPAAQPKWLELQRPLVNLAKLIKRLDSSNLTDYGQHGPQVHAEAAALAGVEQQVADDPVR